MYLTLIVVLSVINFVKLCDGAPLVEGSACFAGTSRKKGKCRFIEDCPQSQNQINFSDICSFINGQALICCLKTTSLKVDIQTTLKPTSSDDNPIIFNMDDNEEIITTALAPGSLSNTKCKLYYPSDPDLISGGSKASFGEFPHMARLGYERLGEDGICGGSLISKKFVLTAAHCIGYGGPNYVRLGFTGPSRLNDSQKIQIKTITSHPLYQKFEKYHDIALLELDREVKFTNTISPACLNANKQHIPKKLIATGWGKTSFSGSTSESLLKVNLSIVPHDTCADKVGTGKSLPVGLMRNAQICASGKNSGDACQGDSGGPLQVKNKARSLKINVYDIVGITSIGKGCGILPGIYTNISEYIQWIEQIVWLN